MGDSEHQDFAKRLVCVPSRPPQTETRLFVSTATVFRDRPHAISEKDENTIITDYWLNFMSVRRRDENPSVCPRRDLELKVDDFCRRLDLLSTERSTLADELDRVRRDVRSEFATGLKSSPQLRIAGPDELRGPLAEPGRGSLLDRVRTGLYLGIQKLL